MAIYIYIYICCVQGVRILEFRYGAPPRVLIVSRWFNCFNRWEIYGRSGILIASGGMGTSGWNLGCSDVVIMNWKLFLLVRLLVTIFCSF